ncbi:MAG TPA: tetratricopeptide repeat protein [Parafilimonas sp.]|nr:tetratricopeptide repeat protein [Parafilimonas sp.]
MKKQQWILVAVATVLFCGLYFFGNTVNPQKPVISAANNSEQPVSNLSTQDVLTKSKQGLNATQQQKLSQMENSVVRGDVHNQQIQIDHQLASYWMDSLHNEEIGAYYAGEAAKLENSEKNLTFAAHLLLDNMMATSDVAMQHWLATQAKELFEIALKLNPQNDSSKIGLGACYMFGNISENPMQGILAIKEIADKNPDNIYAQMMLGLGGIQSGQYDKAAERFLNVIKIQPDNIEAILNLAQVYDRQNDKANAIKWYNEGLKYIQVPEARNEIQARIKSLQ